MALLDVKDIYFDEEAGALEGSAGGDGSASDGSQGDAVGQDVIVTCNADLKTDKKNCGACNHDCSEGECADGLCTLANNLPAPQTVVVRGGFAYIALIGDFGPLSGVAKCPTNGCLSPMVGLAKLNPADAAYVEPFKIAVNDTHVYATDYYGFANGGLWRMNAAGGGYVHLPPTPALPRSYGVAVDDASVVFASSDSNGGIHWCALPDCAGGVKDATASNTPTILAIAPNGNLVWAENDGFELRRCASRTACAPAPLVTFAGVANDLVIDADVVYWGTTRGEILSCALAGCANPTLITDGQGTVTALAVSGKSVYWASMPRTDAGTPDDKEGHVRACTIGSCTGAGIREIASKQLSPEGMAIDAVSVYWANSGEYGTTAGTGNVMKAPR